MTDYVILTDADVEMLRRVLTSEADYFDFSDHYEED